MNQAQAVAKANEFVFLHTGITTTPASAKLVERPDAKYWTVVYSPEAFFVTEAARGVTIDGPYVLRVDVESGDVSVVG